MQPGSIRIVGTNALHAYEALTGVVFSRAATATGDLDLLVDDRNRLQLVPADGRRKGLIALIQKKGDRTFHPRGPGDFRLINERGDMIEFIRPQPGSMHRHMPGAEPPGPDPHRQYVRSRENACEAWHAGHITSFEYQRCFEGA